MVINCHENNITKQTLLMLLDIGFIYFMQNTMSLFSFVHCQNHVLKYLVNRYNKYWGSILKMLLVFIVYLQVVLRLAC